SFSNKEDVPFLVLASHHEDKLVRWELILALGRWVERQRHLDSTEEPMKSALERLAALAAEDPDPALCALAASALPRFKPAKLGLSMRLPKLRLPRRRFLIALALVIIGGLCFHFNVYYHVKGWLHGDAYYKGMPTCYWADCLNEDHGTPDWLKSVYSFL